MRICEYYISMKSLSFNKLTLLTLFTLSTILLPSQGKLELTLLHTNDVHARIEQSNKYNGECAQDDAQENKCYGGVARRYTQIEEIRNEVPNVLLLDAGDQFQGTLWFTTYEGAATAYFMKKLRYDAMVLGNHEFDNGVTGLIPFIENVTSSFPVISANINATKEPALNSLLVKSTVKTIDGEEIGIVGYTFSGTPFLVDRAGIQNIIFEDEISAVRQEVERLQSMGINKIIALGHSGIEIDKEIAEQIEGVDVVVGGHSNTFLYSGEPPSIEEPEGDYPIVVHRDDGSTALLVTAYAYGKYLGHLNVTFDDDGVLTDWVGNPILLNGTIEEDPDVLADVIRMSEPLVELRQLVLGTTVVHLDGERTRCRKKECNLGNLVTDAIVYAHLRPTEDSWTKGSIAIWNTGGIRTSIVQGNITMSYVLQVLPFRNQISLVTLNGSSIRQILEHSASSLPEITAGFLQVSGLRITYDEEADVGSRVQSVQARCANCTIPMYYDLEDDKHYGVFISTFLIAGGDSYVMIEDLAINIEYIGTLAAEAMAKYIPNNNPVFIGEEGRMQIVTSTPNMTSTSDPPSKPGTDPIACKPIPSGGESSIKLPIVTCMSLFIVCLLIFEEN